MPLLRRCAPVLVVAMCACAVPNTGPAPANAPAYVPANAPPPTVTAASNDLVGPVWLWQRTQSRDGRSSAPDAPERYSLSFQPGGRVNLRADCNRGSGSYEINGGNMRMGPAAVTKMGCPPGSRDGEFLRDLARVSNYTVANGELALTLAGDGGAMRFRPQQ